MKKLSLAIAAGLVPATAARAEEIWQTLPQPPAPAAPIRGAGPMIMKDASHFAMWQQPEAFNATVLAFLKGK